jgi:hypothetical protein
VKTKSAPVRSKRHVERLYSGLIVSVIDGGL